ncbi:type III-B CRISPR module RAMP protein Cmr1 [Anoxybacter fermentans]|uniref:Type III-B CRISPR module RAMP protein Cmr1 n=1 Tax=Anoxybacter fermentans TaxID=1323375 RepID=A0A3S9SUU2_9FIRM|nr:type III-B CRISPR module RAMP protein Cmr1 [Anoxybacter fermentans]AZR72029.1 type III-B CRISPR module RAMP protein Cmr1 [Anoxybacter fermentans]
MMENTEEKNPLTIRVNILTKLWTGDIDGKNSERRLTGIIGSIRWWMEALVRGLDGFACDPTDTDSKSLYRKCEFDSSTFKKKFNETGSYRKAFEESLKSICPVCQIFGCGGLSSAFRWVKKEEDNSSFTLELIPLRPVSQELWWLLDKTLHIITTYGAVGGKITQKPYPNSDINYGIVEFAYNFSNLHQKKLSDIKTWIKDIGGRQAVNSSDLPNFKYFWFIPGFHLKKDEINKFLRLDDNGNKINTNLEDDEEDFYEFLRGNIGESKKIFSFPGKSIEIDEYSPWKKLHELFYSTIEIERLWGYVRDEKDVNKVESILSRLTRKEIIKEKIIIGVDLIEQL